MTTVRIVLSIVAVEELHLEQLDVKTAFLHGDLKEDIYMVQPEGFQNGNTRSVMDHCCYFKQFDSSYIILLLYVDDMLIAGSNMREINRLKRQMSEEFEMKDMGAAKQILGMSIIRNRAEGMIGTSQAISASNIGGIEISERSVNATDVDVTGGRPFAMVDEISEASPAVEDGLQLDDQIIKFGTVEFGDALLPKLPAEAQTNRVHAVSIVVNLVKPPLTFGVEMMAKRGKARSIKGRVHVSPLFLNPFFDILKNSLNGGQMPSRTTLILTPSIIHVK
ncbi:hypothetical protein AgCh_006620 [Apium graveolens]